MDSDFPDRRWRWSGYSLNKYGVVNLGAVLGSKATGSVAPSAVDTVEAAGPAPHRATPETNDVRVRVNIWVGCVGGLVANGGLDTAPGSIYANKGLKVSFKIIDDWTEGAAALATNNVDVMLTTADVWAKDLRPVSGQGRQRARRSSWWTGRAAPMA